MRFLALTLALLCAPALAGDEMVYKADGVTIRLTLANCEVAPIAAALVAAGIETPPRAAWIQVGATEIPACWAAFEDKVLLGDVLGNGGFLPKAAFKKSSGI